MALAAPAARADTCGPAPGLDLVQPVDGSTGVDPAAQIVVRHSLADAPTDGAPDVTLTTAGGDEVAGEESWDGRQVVIVPDEPLAEGAYEVVAIRPGRDPYEFGFETSGAADGPGAPALGPELAVTAEYLGGGPEGDDRCGPIGFERYRIHLDLPAAEGTSGPQNVMYVAFQTRGHDITDPTEVARAVDEEGDDQVRIDLYVAANGVSGRACFRVLATDVTGPPSGTTDEACVRLEEGPFFVSICSAVAPGAPRPASGVLVLAGLIVALRRTARLR